MSNSRSMIQACILLLSVLLVNSADVPTTLKPDTCYGSDGQIMYLSAAITIPIALNIVSIFIIGFTLYQVKQLKNMSEKVSTSAQGLARMAVRVGIGSTAKKALVDFAKGKPEFAQLMGGEK